MNGSFSSKPCLITGVYCGYNNVINHPGLGTIHTNYIYGFFLTRGWLKNLHDIPQGRHHWTIRLPNAATAAAARVLDTTSSDFVDASAVAPVSTAALETVWPHL